MAARATHGWWIRKAKQGDIQGLVGKSFKALDHAVALFLNLEYAEDEGWLPGLSTVMQITSGTVTEEDARAAALAFTCRGLEISGLPEFATAQFDRPFREGMTERNRARRLGDLGNELHGEEAPKWLWSGDTDASKARVHALLLLYAREADDLKHWRKETEAVLKKHGCAIPHALDLSMITSSDGKMLEHFGFVDGVSQPIPLDDFWDIRDARAQTETKKPKEYDCIAFDFGKGPKPDKATLFYHGIPTGDVLFGRPDSYREFAPSPFLPAEDQHVVGTLDDQQGAAPIGFRDFGYDGTYLVVRQLNQDVAGFWKQAKAIGQSLNLSGPEMAARMMGRTLDGGLLRPSAGRQNPPTKRTLWQRAKTALGVLMGRTPTSDDQGFAMQDPHGFGCPLGSHVRRANPRDSGAKAQEDIEARLDSANNHRILRRGRPYGDKLDDRHVDDGKDRGLLFMCLNTDIARQFEFIQETWLLSRQFGELDEADPVLGPSGSFTLPDAPARRRVNIDTFVRPVGGEYFFLPGIKALRYLEAVQSSRANGKAKVKP